jgi:hypothetical protein
LEYRKTLGLGAAARCRDLWSDSAGDIFLEDERAGRTGSLVAHRCGARIEIVLSLLQAACGIPNAFASNK